ncbi:MAG: hypothetical protein LBS94_00645 [Prevotellaceae bacterium]|jgi:hypothetical protein|nr:hypothetical protein [Prevotellaceae bacterium]
MNGTTIHLRPLDVLLRLAAVLAFFFIVSLIFPAQGIQLSPRVTLTFPSIDALLDKPHTQATDAFTIDCSEHRIVEVSAAESEPDKNALLPLSCSPEQVKELLPVQPIEYPDNSRSAMRKLFEELASLRTDKAKQVRLLHYGDSQIEADRMTMILRQQLQREYGGGGLGYVALNPQIPINPTVKISMSGGWQSSTPAVKYKLQKPLRVGHLLSSVRCSPKLDKPAWIKVERRPIKAYPPLRFSRVKVMLSNRSEACQVEVSTPTKTIFAGEISADEQLQQLNLNMGSSRENITLSFRGGAPEVYGIALDYNSGVACDNIPLRSSSGVDFGKADAAYLAQAYNLLDVRGIVMQFGTNVVPKIVSSYAYYEEQLYAQLTLLRRLAPQASILVVGVADMARRGSSNALESYPNIEKIRNAQRNAALRAGCAFWDSYAAMGGKNSIVSWAYAQPSLAAKDFCHFSNVGATLMAELLCRSLLRDLHQSEQGSNVASVN